MNAIELKKYNTAKKYMSERKKKYDLIVRLLKKIQNLWRLNSFSS